MVERKERRRRRDERIRMSERRGEVVRLVKGIGARGHRGGRWGGRWAG